MVLFLPARTTVCGIAVKLVRQTVVKKATCRPWDGTRFGIRVECWKSSSSDVVGGRSGEAYGQSDGALQKKSHRRAATVGWRPTTYFREVET